MHQAQHALRRSTLDLVSSEPGLEQRGDHPDPEGIARGELVRYPRPQDPDPRKPIKASEADAGFGGELFSGEGDRHRSRF
jgi:hypothetical protein